MVGTGVLRAMILYCVRCNQPSLFLGYARLEAQTNQHWYISKIGRWLELFIFTIPIQVALRNDTARPWTIKWLSVRLVFQSLMYDQLTFPTDTFMFLQQTKCSVNLEKNELCMGKIVSYHFTVHIVCEKKYYFEKMRIGDTIMLY